MYEVMGCIECMDCKKCVRYVVHGVYSVARLSSTATVVQRGRVMGGSSQVFVSNLTGSLSS